MWVELKSKKLINDLKFIDSATIQTFQDKAFLEFILLIKLLKRIFYMQKNI